MADTSKSKEGAGGDKPPEDPSKVLRGMDPEVAGRAARFLEGLKSKPSKKGDKKSFWEILHSLFGDEEVGVRAREYRPWYVGLDPKIIEVLDRHHERFLTDVESVRNWLTMTLETRIDRAKLSFENSADRSLTKFLKDWSDEIDGSGVREPSDAERDARIARERAVQARKLALAQRRRNRETHRQGRSRLSRLLWPF